MHMTDNMLSREKEHKKTANGGNPSRGQDDAVTKGLFSWQR